MDSVTLYMSTIAGVFSALGLVVWFMARRQRLREEAEEADRAAGTAAE